MEFRVLEASEAEAQRNQGKGVITCDGNGNGVVLWPVGVLRMETDGSGSTLVDLGLDDAPLGLSVWEGTYHFEESITDPGDGVLMPLGDFRLPTSEEWEAIKAGKCPWPEHWNSGVDCSEP